MKVDFSLSQWRQKKEFTGLSVKNHECVRTQPSVKPFSFQIFLHSISLCTNTSDCFLLYYLSASHNLFSSKPSPHIQTLLSSLPVPPSLLFLTSLPLSFCFLSLLCLCPHSCYELLHHLPFNSLCLPYPSWSLFPEAVLQAMKWNHRGRSGHLYLEWHNYIHTHTHTHTHTHRRDHFKSAPQRVLSQ